MGFTVNYLNKKRKIFKAVVFYYFLLVNITAPVY